jgi:hypothetical protein
MARPYLGCFYGQGPFWNLEWGGSLTSPGITSLSSQARAIGFDSDCYTFGPSGVRASIAKFTPLIRNGAPLCLLGYSLGVTSITYLQTIYPVRLLLALAGSSLGQNHAINRHNTERSVLWNNPDSFMSNAGAGLNFNVVHSMPGMAHLAFDVAPSVQSGIMDELKRLQEELNHVGS